MRVHLLDVDDPRWPAALRTMPHDFYSLPRYAALAASTDGGTPVAALAEGGAGTVLMPLLLRDIPRSGSAHGDAPWRDAASPYGYPGIGCATTSGAGDATPLVRAALPAIAAALRERRVVSLFLRLNPLLPVDAGALGAHGVVVEHGATVSIDLTVPEDELFREMRAGHAKDLRRLASRGFTCECDDTCRPESIATFVEIYTETMDRLGAAAGYYFDADYLTRLIAALDDRAMIALVRPGDREEVAAVGLYTAVNGTVQSHLRGTRAAYLPVAPTKLETVAAARWAKARGNRTLHLGGGLGGREDALFRFKSGFSPRRHPFQTARLVLDPVRYGRLTASWAAAAGRPAAEAAGFFPAYRAPVAAPVPLIQPVIPPAAPPEIAPEPVAAARPGVVDPAAAAAGRLPVDQIARSWSLVLGSMVAGCPI